MDCSSLSDHELSQMLKDYGVDVGPINVATRKVYENKLHKLKTGENIPRVPQYQPVANDEEDQEIQFKSPPKPQPKIPVASAITPEPPQPRLRRDNVDNYSPSVNSRPEPTQPRLRRDADNYSPLIESRPSLSSARKTTMTYSHETRRQMNPPTADDSPVKEKTEGQSQGLPLWLVFVALLVVGVLVYLIYSNMESSSVDNIPKIPNKMEV